MGRRPSIAWAPAVLTLLWSCPAAAQEGLLAADVAWLGNGTGHDLVPYLRGQLVRRGMSVGVPLDLSVSGWINLRDPSFSVLNIEEWTAETSLGPAHLRLGIGDLPWGLSELRSPVDVLAPRAVLWDVTRGRRLGQPVVALSAFRSWGTLEAAVLPLSRPVDLGGALTETWSGRTLVTAEEWGDHPAWALRLSRVLGPVDLALFHVQGSDRGLWGSPEGSGDAALSAPPVRLVGTELQWSVGPTVVYGEAAWARRGGSDEARGLIGVEWFATPFLSLQLEQGLATSRSEERIPLATDLLVGARMYTETLRLGAQVAIDPGSANRHFWVDARWTLGELLAMEAELVGWGGDASREPPTALRQTNAVRLSLIRYF